VTLAGIGSGIDVTGLAAEILRGNYPTIEPCNNGLVV
jgi:hypothetical protein